VGFPSPFAGSLPRFWVPLVRGFTPPRRGLRGGSPRAEGPKRLISISTKRGGGGVSQNRRGPVGCKGRWKRPLPPVAVRERGSSGRKGQRPSPTKLWGHPSQLFGLLYPFVRGLCGISLPVCWEFAKVLGPTRAWVYPPRRGLRGGSPVLIKWAEIAKGAGSALSPR